MTHSCRNNDGPAPHMESAATVRGRGRRPVHASFACVLLLGASALGGCGGGGAPKVDPQPSPSLSAHRLEQVPFGALGAGKVVFLRADYSTTGGRDGVYLIDADRATATFEFAGGSTWFPNAPTVSPDGSSVAYTRYTDTNTAFDVYAANLNGSGEHRISAFPVQEGPPSWTPDGRELVFYAAGADWLYNLYRQSAASSAATSLEQLTHYSSSCASQCPGALTTLTDRVAVSPSGQFAWVSDSTIELTAPDGSTTTAIYTLPAAAPGTSAAVHAPVWSPDGQHLGFLTLVIGNQNGMPGERQAIIVTVIDADGGNETIIATAAASGAVEIGGYADAYSLCWTPDGARFVFNVPDGDPQSHLWVVNVDGSALTQVTSAPGVWDMSVSCAR